MTPLSVDQACPLFRFLCEGETEGRPVLTSPNGPPVFTTTSSSPAGSISGLLAARQCWIWLHSLGPTSTNVPPSIHQTGWPWGGWLWSAWSDSRWMRNRGYLPPPPYLHCSYCSCLFTFPPVSLQAHRSDEWQCYSATLWRSQLPWKESETRVLEVLVLTLSNLVLVGLPLWLVHLVELLDMLFHNSKNWSIAENLE